MATKSKNTKATTTVGSKSTKSTSTFNPLAEIKRKFRRGEITQLADKLGFSPSYVSRVLNGTRKNADVVKAAKAKVGRRK